MIPAGGETQHLQRQTRTPDLTQEGLELSVWTRRDYDHEEQDRDLGQNPKGNLHAQTSYPEEDLEDSLD
eukprot:NODE_1933_length_1247_cov_4.645242_g1602_i0.p5 GENE.NODE_1933_length_1247_cov_4.645242_g1602_i0~~NODE_1933_length_1247_cov_4.645242_g1602_i0.p5  ORF type:complete len:69 (+),score=8.44 NODE_1933_length_1247_cov_4.645242_g1602_i0:66-272(+)